MVRKVILFFLLNFLIKDLIGCKVIAVEAKINLSPLFKLEPLYSGTFPLYLGQRAYVGYKFSYNVNVDLIVEQLPLLKAEGFKKIGEPIIQEIQESQVSIKQILQQIEAVKVGQFIFESSKIQGYAYQTDQNKDKIYNKKLLNSETQEVVLTVVDFPALNKPVSFNGALGDFTFKVDLISPSKIALGETCLLNLSMTGIGQLETLQAPNLCCQPGFSGFFKLSDLPASSKIQKNQKIFNIELIPQNLAIKEIPSIEFSFFDLATSSYKVIKSPAIAIEIIKENSDLSDVKIIEKPVEKFEKEIAFSPFKELVNAYYLPFFLIPLGLSILLIQIHYKHYKMVQKQNLKKSSWQLFQAAKSIDLREKRYFCMEQALRQFLVEQKVISNSAIPIDKIPNHPVKFILKEIELNLFSKVSEISLDELQEKIEKLIKNL